MTKCKREFECEMCKININFMKITYINVSKALRIPYIFHKSNLNFDSLFITQLKVTN